MKKAILLIAILVPFFFSSSPAFSDEIVLKAKEKEVWEMHNEKGEFIGMLKKHREGFMWYDKGEGFMGLILTSKKLLPKGYRTRTTKISPELAKAYLDVLKAMEKMETVK